MGMYPKFSIYNIRNGFVAGGVRRVGINRGIFESKVGERMLVIIQHPHGRLMNSPRVLPEGRKYLFFRKYVGGNNWQSQFVVFPSDENLWVDPFTTWNDLTDSEKDVVVYVVCKGKW